MTVSAAAIGGAADAAAVTREGPRVGELDGIRAIAIWMVLIIHITMQGDAQRAGTALHGFGRLAFLAVDHMWLGVDLFFVLSGFLITGILLDAKHRPAYFRKFYIRRALRILPLVVVVIAVMMLIAPGYPRWYAFGLLFLSDIAPQLNVASPAGAPPLWSLAVEEQFYLLWPVIVLALTSRRLVVLALAIVAIEPLIRFLTFGSALEVPWCRSDGLAMGALAAAFVRRPEFGPHAARRLVTAIACGVVALGLIELIVRDAALSGALRLTEADLVFGAAIVAVVAWSGSRWSAPLRSRPMRFFADTSFCVYLIHVPIIEHVGRLGAGAAHAPFLAAVYRGLFVLSLTFALAALSHRYLESPLMRLKAVLTR
jgi:peptidoglycan/LPS O-acetylase OafA/YrhL